MTSRASVRCPRGSRVEPFRSSFLPRYAAFSVLRLIHAANAAFGTRTDLPMRIPAIRPPCHWLHENMGWFPLFSTDLSGPGVFPAGLVLAIMILPTVTAVSREVLRAVPDTQREGMLALGATKWETISKAVLPYARGGIAGALILGLARALGETMAVTMVIGNSSTRIQASLFTPGYTLASAIANQFTEADKAIYFSAIITIALVLLLVACVLNILARLLVWSVSRGPGAGAVRA